MFNSPYSRNLYSREAGPGLSLVKFLMRESLDGVLRFLSSEGGIWLEVGCGPGGFLVNMSEIANMCIGVDIDDEILSDAAARTRHLLGSTCVTRASSYYLPFRTGFFDGLVCLETEEHLEDVRFLREVSRVLKPGGRFVFSIPVEIGSALPVRQAARFFLGLRCPAFAPMEYSPWDFVRVSLRIGDVRLYREKHKVEPVSDHMFFSYRRFLEDLDRHFELEALAWYPIPFPGPWSFNIHGRAVKR